MFYEKFKIRWDLMTKDTTKVLLKNTMWFGIGNFGSKILSFLLVPLYTNYLTPYEFGKIDLMITTINLLVYICTLSIGDAVFRFCLDDNENKEVIFNSGIFVIIVSSVAICFIYPIIIRYFQDWGYFWILYICISLVGFLTMFLQATQKTKIFATQGILYTFSLSILNIVLLMKIKLGVSGYFISMIVAYILSIIFICIQGRIYILFKLNAIKKEIIFKMLRYSIPLVPASVAWWIIASMDRYMIAYMYGEGATGLYAAAQKIPTIIAVLNSFFIKAWQISAVKIKEYSDSSEYFSNLYKILMSIGFLLSFLLVLTSKVISKFFLAREFFVAWEMIPCLVASSLFSAISLFIGAQFTAYKKSFLHLTSNALAMFFNFLFNYIFLKIIGPVGATLATMFSFFIVLTYRQVKVGQLMIFKYDKLIFYLNSFLLMTSCIFMALDIKNWERIAISLFAIFVGINYKDYKRIILKLISYRKQT